MTSAELRVILDQFHLTQGAAARFLGHHRRSMEKWAAGDRQIPPTVAIVLRLLPAGRITADDIEWARGGTPDPEGRVPERLNVGQPSRQRMLGGDESATPVRGAGWLARWVRLSIRDAALPLTAQSPYGLPQPRPCKVVPGAGSGLDSKFTLMAE
jgi:hypothetical protein